MFNGVVWLALKIQFLGHAFFKLNFSGKTALVDPFFGRAQNGEFKRIVKCPIVEKDVKKADVILITHEHFDHFEPKMVERLSRATNACVVAHDSILNQISLPKPMMHSIDTAKKINCRGLQIEAVHAHHPQSFYPMGFLISDDTRTVYHAGDTQLLDTFSQIKADVALLPIGGNETMDCVDAVRATKIMKPGYVIPMHYNTYEVIKQDPQEFRQKIEKSILKTKPIILAPGQTFNLK